MNPAVAASLPAVAAPAARGPHAWLRSLTVMLRFDWARTRQWAPFMVFIQLVMGAGMAVMYGFFYPEVSPETALYITTGVPTLALIPLGFVLVPSSVGQQKLEGSFDFIWSLPTPRSAQITSTFLLYTALALPGTVLALLVATWRYGVSLSPSLLLVPAILLSAVMAVSVGFGMSLAIPDPMITNLITNALIFVVLLFSPIAYPASNLPGWLLRVHEVLPFYPMSVVIRAGLTDGLATDVGRSFLVLAAWTVVGAVLTAWVVERRP